MTKKPLSSSQALLWGGLYGLQAWVCYWVVETGFVTFSRWALRRHTAPPQSALFVGILLLIYLSAGGLLGAAAGWATAALRPAAPWRALRAATTLTVLLAVVTATRQFIESWKGPVLGLLILLCVAAACDNRWGKHLSAFANPWVACLLVIGAYVAYSSGFSNAASIGLFLVYAVTVAVAGMFWTRRTASKPVWPAGRSLAVTMLAAFAIVGVTMALTPFPITAAGPKGAAPAGSPNVILIVMDTVSAQHMSLYGYSRDTTPRLRDFAREATTYTHAFSAGDMTLVAHASMFTGLFPAHHGAHYEPESPLGRPLSDKHQTLAKMLAANQYDTIGVVANDGYVSDQYGLAQGFAYYDQRPPRAPQRATPLYTLSGRVLEALSDRWPTHYFMRISRTAREINVEAGKLLSEKERSNRPFFLFLNYLDAHTPYTPEPPYDTFYPGKDPALNKPQLDQMRWDLFTSGKPMTPAATNHLVSQYDGAIAYLDNHLGRLFASLRDKGLFDNSLVIVTSDHGEAFGEHDILNHGGMALYQSQVSIPLLIKYPGQKAGTVVDGAASNVDLLPTVLEALKLPAPAGLDGRSLRTSAADRVVVSESYPGGTAVYINPKRFGRSYSAIVRWPFKLIRPSPGALELYDLAQDPLEQRNLYDPENGTARVLNARLSLSLRAPALKGKRPANIDAETYQRLKSLGYVQ